MCVTFVTEKYVTSVTNGSTGIIHNAKFVKFLLLFIKSKNTN